MVLPLVFNHRHSIYAIVGNQKAVAKHSAFAPLGLISIIQHIGAKNKEPFGKRAFYDKPASLAESRQAEAAHRPVYGL